MISNVQFWRDWPAPLKIALSLVSVLLLTLIGLLLYYFFNDINNVLHWNVATELNKKFIATEAFVEKGLRFTNNELVYYLKEWFLPSFAEVNSSASSLLLVGEVLGLSLVLTALTFQNSKWFLTAIITLAAFLLTARTEIVFQTTSNSPFLIGFLGIGALLFAFSSYFKKLSFWGRWLGVLVAFLLLLILSVQFSKVGQPILALANYGLLFPVLVFAIFVFLIAHEGMASIVWAVSKSAEKGKSSVAAFAGLGIIYLLNCLLIYLENTKEIEDSFMVVSPVVLFILSCFIGIWGFKKQTENLELFSFQRSGAWLYFGMAIISSALLGFVYATANDPLIELLSDYIAITHLAVGLVFFGHVFINFLALLKNGFDVHLVLYKPMLSRLLLAKLLAVFLIAFLLIQKNTYSYHQLKAGLDNAVADFYLAEGENTAAETYFKESITQDLYNHKANYALASMAKNVGDGVTAAYYFRQAIQKNATEFAYIGLSLNLEQEDLFFDALFTMREGLQNFPKSAVLATNTARLLEKANARDSVYFYLDLAAKNCKTCNTENVNMQAFWIENARAEKLDSVSESYANGGEVNIANQLAISRMSGILHGQLQNLSPNTVLNTAGFAALYNQFTLPENELNSSDSLWNGFIENEANMGVIEDLLFLKAKESYQNGNKISGIKQLTYLAVDSTETGLMYRRTLGMWYLNEGLYDKAVFYLKSSGDLSSTKVLEENNFRSHLISKQLQVAGELLQSGLSNENYQELVNQEPFNPFVLTDISDFLLSENKISEAYRIVFDALEFNESSIILWKKYSLLALKNGVPDYAQNGLTKLRSLLSVSDYAAFVKEFDKEQMDIREGFEAFD